MARLSFLLRPRWLLSHVLVVVLVVVMVNLGFWQLDRLDQRRERNDLISGRQGQPVVQVDELLAAGDDPASVEDVRFRAVAATGEYDGDGTVVVRNRTLEGIPGAWLLTPLVLETGEEVGVIRGFVALSATDDAAMLEPPEGQVTVSGVVIDPEGLDGTAPRDVAPVVEADGTLPGLLMAESSDPAETEGAEALHAVPLPDLEEGPHLAYAVQWFIFSAIAIIGYPLVLRHVVQRREKEDGRLGSDGKVQANGATEERDIDVNEILRSGG